MQSSPQLELMEGDPNSTHFSICKMDVTLQKHGCISILNEEAYLNQNDGEGMAPGSADQGSVKDDVAMCIVKRRERDVPSCLLSSKEQPALRDAPKGLETSACKQPLRVVEAVTQDAHSSKFVTLGKRPYDDKASPEVSYVRQSKKGATQSGIMDFLTAREKKQDFKQDKSLNWSLKSTKMQTKWGAESHRDTIRIPLNEKEDNSLASTLNLASTNFECAGYALKKEDDQKCSLLNPTGFNYKQESEPIESEFFLPASKKCRLQRRQEAANVFISDCTRASKRDSLGPRRCKPNDVKVAEATSRSGLIILKQPTKNEDFFRPAAKKQKQIMNKEVTMKPESITKAEIRDEKYFEFDLQMEAKRAAEENAQLSAGKPTHPFFSQHKVGPRSLSICCSFWDVSFTPSESILEAEDLTPAPPLHINQLDKAKECEAGSQMASFAPSRGKDQPVFKAGFSAKSREELRMVLKRPFVGKSCKTSRLKLCCADHTKKHLGVSSSSCAAAGSISRNLLWTDLYQPQLPEQVCGNKELVKSLSEWLQNWQIRHTSLVGRSEGDMFHRTEDCDEEKGWSEEDSDGVGNTSNEYLLPNVLVLVGPVGCGKTASIYACAKAHGYTVIETTRGLNTH